MAKRPLTLARIGVIMGGRSAEREISLRTGRAVHAALLRRGYNAVGVDPQEGLVEQLQAKKVELAFLALHGPGGEDGTIQGLFEVLGIAYTGSGVRASALAMHKPTAKALLEAEGIPVPAGTVIRAATNGHNQAAPPAGMRLPLVVKPAAQGSTIGISIVRKPADWVLALKRAHEYDPEAVIESYIPGREITVSILSGKVLPAIEIVAPDGFYDYAAKYEKGHTRYLCPAPMAPRLRKRVQELALQSYQVMGCEGAARVDFRVTPQGRPYVLEINTIPGMTDKSLLPMAAAKAGIDYDSLTERILESALRRARGPAAGEIDHGRRVGRGRRSSRSA